MSKKATNNKLVGLLILSSIAMFGFGFALVPLYDVLCQVLGINGKTNNKPEQYSSMIIDTNREVNVEFVTHISGDMPWQFAPQVKRIKVQPGALIRTHFEVKNQSSNTVIGQAIPSVSPGRAAAYFNKTECFCFNQQTLTALNNAELPLIFYIDPDLPKDINTVTLSYTLFDITAKNGGGNAKPGVAR